MLRTHNPRWNMKGKKPTLKQFTCEDCGEDFWRPANLAKFCDACRKLRAEETRERAEMNRVRPKVGGHRNDSQFRMIVEVDPDPRGGFSVGARLSEYEVEQMLKLKTFTPGTVLRDETRACHWYVVQDKRGQWRKKLGA